MGTSWASVITEDALLIINDLRLNDELEENPALFFRKMAFYMKSAVPRFNRPPEMKEQLAYTEPEFAAVAETVEETQAADFTIATEKTGYELMSAGTVTQDVYGNPIYTPISGASYDEDTGAVTIPASADAPIEAGTVISLDFYTDGSFENELTGAQRRILGLCIQYVWETAFVNDWLNRAPRAKDRSFDAGNVANQVRTNTERITAVKRALDDAISAYSQNNAYMREVKSAGDYY